MWTPLCVAILENQFECLKLLLDGGANPNLTGKDGVTPLVLAANCNNVKNISVELLAYGAKVC